MVSGKIYKLKLAQLFIISIITIIILSIIISFLSDYGSKYGELEIERIENIIERYSIQCYATEGGYPPNIDYLVEHYGLILDESKYIYEYEPIGENVKPIIKVFTQIGYGEKLSITHD